MKERFRDGPIVFLGTPDAGDSLALHLATSEEQLNRVGQQHFGIHLSDRSADGIDGVVARVEVAGGKLLDRGEHARASTTPMSPTWTDTPSRSDRSKVRRCGALPARAEDRGGSARLRPVVDSPIVTMLWESVHPLQRLRERFGFDTAAAAVAWVADTLYRHWGLEVDNCERLVMSDWNVMAWVTAGHRRLIAKWSAFPLKFRQLGDAARVSEWLDAAGIPVAAPIPATDGENLVELPSPSKGRVMTALPLPASRFLLGVMPVLEGELLDVSKSDQVADAGRMLAHVHDALAAYPNRFGRGRHAAGSQLVHNDYRSANVLHGGIKITGVLDLEEVKYDTRVADLAKAAVYLGTRYRDWGPTTEEVRSEFVAAYRQESSLAKSEEREVRERMLQEAWVNGGRRRTPRHGLGVAGGSSASTA